MNTNLNRLEPVESDPVLQKLLLQAREALRRAALEQLPTRTSAIVIQFPADRIVHIHRTTGPAEEAQPEGDTHA